jgi:HlyD family secretion protein
MFAVLTSFLSLFSATPAPLHLQGYVEGEYVRIGSPIAGTLTELNVREGDRVSEGATLFSLDTIADRAARDQAAAQLAQAEALLANLRKGKRPDELKAIAAQKTQAEASERLSLATLRRQEALVAPGYATRQALDQARASLERDRALVAQSAADLRVARLGGREDEIAAQEALVALNHAELTRAEKRLSDLAPPAPAAALVEKLFYRPGEYVEAGHPVVSLLPPANVKLVFFIPEPRLGRLAVGQNVAYACDGCAPGTQARISFIASQAEYTPPVIYSLGSRDKLVFRVEARPLADPLALHPGQPVDVVAEPK